MVKEIAMQAEKLKESFAYIEQCVDSAAKACQRAQGTPEYLRNCLDTLERESDEGSRLVQGNIDELELRSFVDRMEEHGDLAMKACRETEGLAPDVAHAIRRAHDSISDLKRQLH
jgi:Fe-S cluster assembly scaffold protein SufB